MKLRWLRRAVHAVDDGPDRLRALVYRGPAALCGCPEAAAALLRASRWGFEVCFVGPHEDLPLSEPTLAFAALYVQPGGGDLNRSYRKLKAHRAAVREFVRAGGRYLGFCLGGYLAGSTPGFGLLPGDADQYIRTRAAEVTHDRDALVDVRWRGKSRKLYFQDGPHFELNRTNSATVLGTYRNGRIAALVAPFGAGQVGVVGPHPEATDEWFIDVGLSVHRAWDLGLDLIDTVMTKGGSR